MTPLHMLYAANGFIVGLAMGTMIVLTGAVIYREQMPKNLPINWRRAMPAVLVSMAIVGFMIAVNDRHPGYAVAAGTWYSSLLPVGIISGLGMVPLPVVWKFFFPPATTADQPA